MIARSRGIRRAVLQERSPSCGSGSVYDGTFTGRLIPGRGVAAALLEENGVRTYSESGIAALSDGEENVK